MSASYVVMIAPVHPEVKERIITFYYILGFNILICLYFLYFIFDLYNYIEIIVSNSQIVFILFRR